MKLDAEDILALKTLLAVCQVGSIDMFLIEDGVARGVNESKTFALISENNIPKFNKSVGIVRAKTLKSRIDVFGNKDISINAVESAKNEISMLEISSGKNKVQFRCANTMLFEKKVPRAINDNPAFSFFISPEDAKMILDAVKVMGAKQIVLYVNGKVSFEISDESNEVFTVSLDTEVEKHADDEIESSVVCYTADVFCNVLQHLKSSSAPILICAKGTLKTVLMGHEIALLPQVAQRFND
jgi:hypothetical protein